MPSPMDQDPRPVGTEPIEPWPLRGLVGGAAVAVASLLLAAIDGAPYLDSSPNPWLVVFAVATFAALLAVPFVINQRIVAANPERAEAWERAMVVWGAVALGAVAAGVALIAAGGYSPAASLLDAAGLILSLEAGLVLGVLVIWLLIG